MLRRVEHLGRILVVESDTPAAEVVVQECARLRRTSLLSSAAEAGRALDTKPKLTALILEQELPDARGATVLKTCRASYPRLPILMLTATTTPKLINLCHLLRVEFVAKPARRRNLKAFLQRAVAFERVPDSRVSAVVEDLVRTRRLSPRETDVLAAATQGVARRVIADQIGTTENTIKSCVRSLLRKCDASNLEEVARSIWLEALAGSDVEGDTPFDRHSRPPGTPFSIPPPTPTTDV